MSSFANASGGHLVYGVSEDDGVPTAVDGLGPIEVDKVMQRLDSLVQSCIKPKIPGYGIHPVEFDDGRICLVIRVPSSWAGPHVVSHERHWRFYSRTSSGKTELDVQQVRDAFLHSESVAQRARDWRAERLGRIVAAETPLRLGDGPKIVLHIVPFGATSGHSMVDVVALLKALRSSRAYLPPLLDTGCSWRLNLDGLLAYQGDTRYLQVFRTGFVETAAILDHIDGAYYLGRDYEVSVLRSLNGSLSALDLLGVAPPFIVGLSILGAQGVRFTPSARYVDRVFEDLNVIVPETVLDGTAGLAESMKPVFDTVCNAIGVERSLSYNEEGQWVG